MISGITESSSSGSGLTSPSTTGTSMAGTADMILKVLDQSDKPQSIVQILKQIPSAVRPSPEVAEQVLQNEQSRQRVFQFPPKRGRVQYWTQSQAEYASGCFQRYLNRGPQSKSELLGSVKNLAALKGFGQPALTKVFDRLLDQGVIRKVPSYLGSRVTLFSLHPADPSDYLRHAISRLSERLGLSEKTLLRQATSLFEHLLDIDADDQPPEREPSPERESSTATSAATLSSTSPVSFASSAPREGSGAVHSRSVPYYETTSRAESATAESAAAESESVESESVESGTTVDPDERLLEAMKNLNPAVETGDMVLISELRRELDAHMPGTDFDEAILSAVARRRVAIHRFDRPHLVPDHERAQMLRDASGNYYNTVSVWRG